MLDCSCRGLLYSAPVEGTRPANDPPASDPPANDPPADGAQPTTQLRSLTVPQWLAFAAFVVFVALAFAADSKPDSTVTTVEFNQVQKLTLFLIAALLPSDALVRFGRGIFFKSAPKGAGSASDTPPATLAQCLAFAAFVVVVLLTLFKDNVISTSEFAQVNDVLRALIIALLPSDAAVRFGRALYLRGLPNVTATHLKKI
jgi:hypothetical protein